VPKFFRRRPKPVAPVTCTLCAAPLELVTITNLLAERSDEYLTCATEPQKHPQLRANQYLTTSLPVPSYKQIRLDGGLSAKELTWVKILGRRR
jgi:hypothetical protein